LIQIEKNIRKERHKESKTNENKNAGREKVSIEVEFLKLRIEECEERNSV